MTHRFFVKGFTSTGCCRSRVLRSSGAAKAGKRHKAERRPDAAGQDAPQAALGPRFNQTPFIRQQFVLGSAENRPRSLETIQEVYFKASKGSTEQPPLCELTQEPRLTVSDELGTRYGVTEMTGKIITPQMHGNEQFKIKWRVMWGVCSYKGSQHKFHRNQSTSIIH